MNAVETLIAEFHERPLPDLTRRDIDIPELPNAASVLIGMRRSGKTYLLFQEMQRLMERGVDKHSMLYLNLEDDRIGHPDVSLLSEGLEAYYRMFPEARSRGAYLFFDEVQAIPDWSRFMRRVLDTENVRLYLTGSSAKLLSTEVATEFRGRSSAVEVLPFSYVESARHAGVEVEPGPTGALTRSERSAHLRTYLEVGGFPAVQTVGYVDRIRTLQDYAELVVVRDVLERHGGTSPHAARWFALSLLRQSGSLFSVNKVYHTMRSQGIEVGKNSLHALLGHLTDAYLVATVSVHTASHAERHRNPRKVYAIDPGLALATSVAAAQNVGARLETAVYIELRRRLGRGREGSIAYYSTGNGREVDFVVGDVEAGDTRRLIQVCADPSEDSTMQREVSALTEAMTELGLDRGTIVTLDAEDEIRIPAGVIDVVPAWRWLVPERD